MAGKEKAGAEAPAKKSKAMLFVVIALVLVIVVGGAGAFMMLSKAKAPPAAEKGEGEGGHEGPAAEMVFIPLDSFTVNLTGDQERFAQIVINLAISDPKAQEVVKSRSPLIRDRVLKIIAQKTAENLLTPQGKNKLAKEVLEAVKSSLPSEHRKSVKEVLFSNFIVQ